METITNFFATLDWTQVLIGFGLFIVSLVLTTLAVAIVMVKIPAHYFSSHYQQDFLPNSPWLVRWGAVIAKNVLGLILIVIGIILSLPGIPGQGILTILLGLIMIDIPGKRPIEARIIKIPKVLNSINSLRKRYNKEPLLLD